MSHKRASDEWALRIQLEREEEHVAQLQARVRQLEDELALERSLPRVRQQQSIHAFGGGFDMRPGSVAHAVAQTAARMLQPPPRIEPAAPLPVVDAPRLEPPAAAPTRWELLEID